MERHLIERWTDTTAFGIALGFAAALVLPVLAMGVVTSAIGGAEMLAASSTGERELEFDLGIEQAVLPLLSLSGVLGFVGYVRAHWAVRDLSRHNVTATLVFLAAGVLAAAFVAAFVAVTAIASWLSPWGSAVWLLPAALFATANVVWAFAGIAWIQRLMHRYAEHTGRAFDGLPVVLLLVAIALVVAAALKTTAL